MSRPYALFDIGRYFIGLQKMITGTKLTFKLRRLVSTAPKSFLKLGLTYTVNSHLPEYFTKFQRSFHLINKIWSLVNPQTS